MAIYFGMRHQATRLLRELKDWMAAHNAAIVVPLLLIIAAALLGDGISGLAA